MKKLVTFLIVISMLLGACNTQPSIQVEYTCPRMYQYIEDLRVDLGEYGVFKPYCYLGKYPKLVLTIPLLEAPAEGTPPSEWKLDYSAPNIVKRGSKNIYELLLDGGEIKFKMPASGLVTLRYGGTGGDKFKVFVSGREWDNLKYWTFFSKPGTEDFIIGKDKKVKILVLPREEILESMYYNFPHMFELLLPAVEFEANTINPKNLTMGFRVDYGRLPDEVTEGYCCTEPYHYHRYGEVPTQEFVDENGVTRYKIDFNLSTLLPHGYSAVTGVCRVDYRNEDKETVWVTDEDCLSDSLLGLEKDIMITFLMPAEGWIRWNDTETKQYIGFNNFSAPHYWGEDFHVSGELPKLFVGKDQGCDQTWLGAGLKTNYVIPAGSESFDMEIYFFNQE